MKKLLLLILFIVGYVHVAAQQLIVINEETDTVQTNYTVTKPKLNDFTYIDSLGNEAIRLDEWRKACRIYRWERRIQEQKLIESKGGIVSASILGTFGYKPDAFVIGGLIGIKRKGNPWGFGIRLDFFTQEFTDKRLVFQELDEETIYADRITKEWGPIFGVGLMREYGFGMPFILYNFGTLNQRINWVNFSVQDFDRKSSGIQFGYIRDLGRLNVMMSYTTAEDYFSVGFGFEIH